MSRTNGALCRMFATHGARSGHSLNMRIEGNLLYSYRLPIALRGPAGIIVGDYTASARPRSFVSRTTSNHIGYIRKFSNRMVHPIIFQAYVAKERTGV